MWSGGFTFFLLPSGGGAFLFWERWVTVLSTSPCFWWRCLLLLFSWTGAAFSLSPLLEFNDNTFSVLPWGGAFPLRIENGEVSSTVQKDGRIKQHHYRRESCTTPNKRIGTQFSPKAAPSRRREKRRNFLPKKEDEPPRNWNFPYSTLTWFFKIWPLSTSFFNLLMTYDDYFSWILFMSQSVVVRVRKRSYSCSSLWDWMPCHSRQQVWILTFLCHYDCVVWFKICAEGPISCHLQALVRMTFVYHRRKMKAPRPTIESTTSHNGRGKSITHQKEQDESPLSFPFFCFFPFHLFLCLFICRSTMETRSRQHHPRDEHSTTSKQDGTAAQDEATPPKQDRGERTASPKRRVEQQRHPSE